jgi:hypothetical protein
MTSVLFMAALAVIVAPAAVVTDQTPTPAEYLTEVLDVVESNAYYADRIDWMQWRSDAAAVVATSQHTADTYDFVLRLLLELDDNHSRFFPPPTDDDDSAFALPLTAPSGGVGADSIGLLRIPVFSHDPAQDDEYVAAAHETLATDACGWIIDLRANTGGDVVPMLAALAPLLGPGPLLAYQHRDGTTDSLILDHDGAVVIIDDHGAVITSPEGTLPEFPPEGRPVRFDAGSPLAVLQSGSTASSGEGVVMALRGRPGVQTFGQPTAGLPTGNVTFWFSDGSAVNLTVAVGVDYGGVVHETAIPPDVAVADDVDAAEIARQWLAEQPACRS